MDLRFKDAPSDLMNMFVNTLVRLPNLRRLELLSVSHRSPVTTGLKRKCARFPNIREMVVDDAYPDFIKSCPNLEDLTFRAGLGFRSSTAIESYGADLKRVAGICFYGSYGLPREFMNTSPDLMRPLSGIMPQMWYRPARRSRR